MRVVQIFIFLQQEQAHELVLVSPIGSSALSLSDPLLLQNQFRIRNDRQLHHFLLARSRPRRFLKPIFPQEVVSEGRCGSQLGIFYLVGGDVFTDFALGLGSWSFVGLSFLILEAFLGRKGVEVLLFEEGMLRGAVGLDVLVLFQQLAAGGHPFVLF
jgi:hypothetical protein